MHKDLDFLNKHWTFSLPRPIEFQVILFVSTRTLWRVAPATLLNAFLLTLSYSISKCKFVDSVAKWHKMALLSSSLTYKYHRQIRIFMKFQKAF